MKTHGWSRRIVGLATVTGLGVALPLTTGAVPAYAQAQLSVTKTHEGDFARGGFGDYLITVTNVGNEDATEGLVFEDNLPTGLTVNAVTSSAPAGQWDCGIAADQSSVVCTVSSDLPANSSFTFTVQVRVAADAPCAVTNMATATLAQPDGSSDSASDPTRITGGECDGGDGGNGGGGGNGGSILPINLSGILPMFNNISINNNIHSPGASNNSRQTFGLNAP
ncbi:DUF11 domain-containing protein [Streptomyces sp. APSN-46.1]|uniref:DUF11 domain-containing protein n=1 Tax=Streptomyces sp. APSN-46.1 TaxID=2929049 RepID=UPI001FB36131|nr:DUF11 domain-containing protein [Streptomyces sp. APSN-46.1]MCJ1677820.1 DUF11 domain-containing protein [Streptomyces sp. APSN-46.1]